ncbi:MAG: hypothetical protein J6J90_03145 [Angelakisella sp.]|nr:hypothetical protein [Angelakisella sp.]
MKKVLALVLAVIMVCTMAMAVTVSGATVATPDDAKINPNYRPITPGKSIIFTRDELALSDTTGEAVLNKDGTFAPEKNKVDVEFEKGTDLIASKGWVKTTEGYKYVITTKANDTAVLDDTADIIISKVTVTKYGIDGTTTYSFGKKIDDVMHYVYADKTTIETTPTKGACLNADGTVQIGGLYKLNDTGYVDHMFYFVFNYGRVPANLNTNGLPGNIPAAADPKISDVLYTVKKVASGDKASKDIVNSYTVDDVKTTIAYNLKAGEKVIFSVVPGFATTTSLTKALQSEIITNDATVIGVLGDTAVVPNKAVKISVNNQKEGAALYMVNADGTLTNLGAKFDDNGVLTATAKITGAVILSDKALTATNVITETTTNPGTGANDVVGVAAALAVVALVSGAAISLKK